MKKSKHFLLRDRTFAVEAGGYRYERGSHGWVRVSPDGLDLSEATKRESRLLDFIESMYPGKEEVFDDRCRQLEEKVRQFYNRSRELEGTITDLETRLVCPICGKLQERNVHCECRYREPICPICQEIECDDDCPNKDFREKNRRHVFWEK